MAAYEVLLLNTSIPQIQAAQSGDTYVVPRDIAFSAALTLSAGTANGVPYLNGSKVLTTGSGLQFDGSNLGLGVTPNTWASGFRALQVGTGIYSSVVTSSDSTYLASNWYYDGAEKYIANGFASFYRQNVGKHIWYTAANNTSGAGASLSPTQAMTLDASGNLGIGDTSPSTTLSRMSARGPYADLASGYGTILAGSTDSQAADKGGTLLFAGVYTGTTATIFAGIKGAKENGTDGNFAGYLSFWSRANGGSPTERARITSGGNFLIGITAIPYNAERLAVYKSGNAEAAAFVNDAGANNYTIAVSNRATTGDNKFAVFATESSDTTRGSIVYNRAAGLVTYATTSDYRAKDISGPVANPGAIIDALKVYEGKMKGATQSRPMLVAHEAQEHAPYAVTGEKDAVNEDGTPKYQQMDVSSLVPLLLAEIQSLRARVAQLEGK